MWATVVTNEATSGADHRIMCPGRGRVWVSQQGRGDDLKILVWKGGDDEVFDYCGGLKMEGGNEVGEITGRMAFHFVMVLVGLLEASIAAKREQDYYYYCLPIKWKLSVDGVPFFCPLLAFFTTSYNYSQNCCKLVSYLFNISIDFSLIYCYMLMRLWNV